jgi:hypothetical protein
VAARLRANRSFSCSLRPRTLRIFSSIRATFFCTVKAYLPFRSGSSRISPRLQGLFLPRDRLASELDLERLYPFISRVHKCVPRGQTEAKSITLPP